MTQPTFDEQLRAALLDHLGAKGVVFMADWRKRRRVPWSGKGRKPVALLVHHSAGAATTSTDPAHPGNQWGANSGQIHYIQTHFQVPAANFSLDRSGIVVVHSAFPVWHAGLGSFARQPGFDALGVPRDMGNDYMLGVEVISKGQSKDFTAAQKVGLGRLAQACQDACGWPSLDYRLPNHRTWAPARKVDTRYDVAQLQAWAKAQAPLVVAASGDGGHS